MARVDQPRYTLTELANLAGVTPRTVRYYTAQGLLPAVGTAGPGAKYGDALLARLRLIRKLQREHLPLAEIRRHLQGLDDATVLTLEEQPAQPPPDSALDYIRRVMHKEIPRPAAVSAPPSFAAPSPAAPSPAAPSPTAPSPAAPIRAAPIRTAPMPAAPTAPPPEPTLHRAQWERISLAPDIELHVRRPLPRTLAKRVDRLIAIGRDLLEEDQP
jgi:DNA-binding transcriptional MerR regulator